MIKLVTLAFVPLIAVVLSQDQTYVTFNLFATDLNGCDDVSACDASVKVFCSSLQSDWTQCGKTRKIQDDNFPIWADDIFNFTHVNGNSERWRFDVFDEDLLFDDFIASATVNVDEIVNLTSNIYRMTLESRGYLSIQKRRI